MEAKFTLKDQTNNIFEKKEISNPQNLKKISKFQKLMDQSDEENEDIKNEAANPLFSSPYFTPFEFRIPQTAFEKLIRIFPAELQNLITPIPALIEHSVAQEVEKTEIKIQLPSNEEVEIILERYDTDLTSFHVSLYGSENVQKLIQDNQARLTETLQKVMPNYGFAISPPFCKPISFSLPKTRRFGYCRVKEGKRKK